MRIIAFDLSLTHTGYAIWDSTDPMSGIMHGVIQPGGALIGMERYDDVYLKIMHRSAGADLVAMEALSLGSRDHDLERAGMNWLFRYSLWTAGRSWISIAPTTAKKFVTGKGNAEKSLILREVYSRFGVEAEDDNAADAAGMLVLCLAALGKYPLMPKWRPLTKEQLEAVRTVRTTHPSVFVLTPEEKAFKTPKMLKVERRAAKKAKAKAGECL